MSELVPMTRTGYDKLKSELDQMESVEMPKLAQRVAAARSEGDLSENAEYHGARESQGMLQAKINLLRDKLSRATIIDPSRVPKGEVAFGATVVVRDLEFGDEEVFVLVGAGGRGLRRGQNLRHQPVGPGAFGEERGAQSRDSRSGRHDAVRDSRNPLGMILGPDSLNRPPTPCRRAASSIIRPLPRTMPSRRGPASPPLPRPLRNRRSSPSTIRRATPPAILDPAADRAIPQCPEIAPAGCGPPSRPAIAISPRICTCDRAAASFKNCVNASGEKPCLAFSPEMFTSSNSGRGRPATHRGRLLDRGNQPRAIRRVQQRDQRQRPLDFIPLQMTNEMPADRQIGQRRGLCPKLLRPAFAQIAAAKRHDFPNDRRRHRLGDRHQRHRFRGPPPVPRRRGNPPADWAKLSARRVMA